MNIIQEFLVGFILANFVVIGLERTGHDMQSIGTLVLGLIIAIPLNIVVLSIIRVAMKGDENE